LPEGAGRSVGRGFSGSWALRSSGSRRRRRAGLGGPPSAGQPHRAPGPRGPGRVAWWGPGPSPSSLELVEAPRPLPRPGRRGRPAVRRSLPASPRRNTRGRRGGAVEGEVAAGREHGHLVTAVGIHGAGRGHHHGHTGVGEPAEQSQHLRACAGSRLAVGSSRKSCSAWRGVRRRWRRACVRPGRGRQPECEPFPAG